MPKHTGLTQEESARRIRARTPNFEPYPHKGVAEVKDKPPRGWRWRAPPTDYTLTRKRNGWTATVRPDEPGKVMATCRKVFSSAVEARRHHAEDWRSMTIPVLSGGEAEWRFVMSRVFDDADEAIEAVNEVMSKCRPARDDESGLSG